MKPNINFTQADIGHLKDLAHQEFVTGTFRFSEKPEMNLACAYLSAVIDVLNEKGISLTFSVGGKDGNSNSR